MIALSTIVLLEKNLTWLGAIIMGIKGLYSIYYYFCNKLVHSVAKPYRSVVFNVGSIGAFRIRQTRVIFMWLGIMLFSNTSLQNHFHPFHAIILVEKGVEAVRPRSFKSPK